MYQNCSILKIYIHLSANHIHNPKYRSFHTHWLDKVFWIALLCKNSIKVEFHTFLPRKNRFFHDYSNENILSLIRKSMNCLRLDCFFLFFCFFCFFPKHEIIIFREQLLFDFNIAFLVITKQYVRTYYQFHDIFLGKQLLASKCANNRMDDRICHSFEWDSWSLIQSKKNMETNVLATNGNLCIQK